MFEAMRGERSSIPAGILLAQNSMGLPNTRTSIPFALRCTAADNP
jgi:hypothetical protein